jgi:hypothetical protein
VDPFALGEHVDDGEQRRQPRGRQAREQFAPRNSETAAGATAPTAGQIGAMFCVPLVQHLSNAEFGRMVRKLTQRSTGVTPDESPAGDRTHSASLGEARPCRCGCTKLVPSPRKFVNQQHQEVWLRRRHYWGRNRPS